MCMKRVWSLTSNVDEIVEKYPQAFAYKEGDACEILLVDYTGIEIKNGSQIEIYCKGKKLELPDAFWMLTGNTDAYIFENLLINAGIPSIKNLAETQVTRSKIATYQRLAANGIRIPETYVFFNHPDKETLVKKFGYPFVIKPDNGFGGEGVELIHNEQELDAYLSRIQYGIAYIAQEFIATSRGRDVRVVTYKGDIFRSYMRSTSDEKEFRSNVHVGGEINEYEIDDKTKELCRKVAGLFDLPIIGIDLLIGDGEFVVVEVNSSPGIPGNANQLLITEIINEYFEKQK